MKYQDLPETIRAMVSYDEFMWLSDDQKNSLEQELTMPDLDSEDPAQ